MLVDTLDFPNSIALSPNEKVLYIADGGDDWKTLFIVTRTTLCAVKLKIPGEPVPLRRA